MGFNSGFKGLMGFERKVLRRIFGTTKERDGTWRTKTKDELDELTHCGRVTQICVFNTVKIGTSASSP